MNHVAYVLAMTAGLGGLAGCLMLSSQHAGPPVLADARSGGETTVKDAGRDAFARPAANLPIKKLRDFAFGNKMFNTNWVVAPASVTSLDGLGPTFNRVSCSSCHFKDGRGRAPLEDETVLDSMLVRLSIPGASAGGGPNPHPAYGLQLNDRAIPGVPPEGRVHIAYSTITGSYPDGTKYRLRKPKVTLHDLQFGSLGEDIMLSPRVAPAVFGLGLLEAVPEETILALADPKDKDGDGISGRPNYVWNSETKHLELGRFGWKANVSTLQQQDASAAEGDIGITTSVVPEENCPPAQEACRNATSGGTPEMSDMQLKKLVFYSQTLAVPQRRNVHDATVQRGAKLFADAACSSCHTPVVKTGSHPVPQLAHQTIQPFTDLLLHDMGKGLADDRPDFNASGREWRTPPLWGIGLVETVNRHHTFLHDGRARNLEEAILWHGGEAEKSRNAFMKLDKEDRNAVLTFLNSL